MKKKTLLNSHEKVSSTDITSEQRKRRKTRPHHSLFDLLLVRRMTETIAIPANPIATDDTILFTVKTESSLGISIRSFICKIP